MTGTANSGAENIQWPDIEPDTIQFAPVGDTLDTPLFHAILRELAERAAEAAEDPEAVQNAYDETIRIVNPLYRKELTTVGTADSTATTYITRPEVPTTPALDAPYEPMPVDPEMFGRPLATEALVLQPGTAPQRAAKTIIARTVQSTQPTEKIAVPVRLVEDMEAASAVTETLRIPPYITNELRNSQAATVEIPRSQSDVELVELLRQNIVRPTPNRLERFENLNRWRIGAQQGRAEIEMQQTTEIPVIRDEETTEATELVEQETVEQAPLKQPAQPAAKKPIDDGPRNRLEEKPESSFRRGLRRAASYFRPSSYFRGRHRRAATEVTTQQEEPTAHQEAETL